MAGRIWTGEERKAQAERATKQMSDPAMRERLSAGVSQTVRKCYAEDNGFGFLATRGKPNAFLGKRHTEKAKQANREAHLGGPGFVGPHSGESRQRMKASQLGNQNALGHKMSAESRQRMIESLRAKWKDPLFLATVAESYSRKPNELELEVQCILDKHFPSEWKYVGDYQVWLGGRNPDFINVDGKKQIIEVFGIFWHDAYLFPNRPTEAELVAHYSKFGFDCLVLWEDTIWEGESVVVEKIEVWRNTLCVHGNLHH